MIKLVAPCRGHITQRHGARQSHNGLPHGGQDYAYYSGGQVTDEVFAAADGVVVYAGDARALGWPNEWYYNPDFDRTDKVDQSAGNVVVVRHNQGGVRFDTTYNHLAAWSVKKGDPVRAGQRIATIGATGFSAGKHLHFELLFHPFNFGTATYGRADPNPYFVDGGLAPQGTTTPLPEEEEDMPTAKEFWEHELPLNGEMFQAGDILAYTRTNAEGAKNNAETAAVKSTAALAAAQAAPAAAVQILLGTRLEAPDGSGKSYTIADYLVFGWWYAMQAKDKPQGPPMDPAALTAAIQASATDVAARLEITVKETP